ncbi:hypothetical protein TSOC_008579 [Tetrabaena socialis]|uniref:Uncharacterized protein n=1 Tax=Tetrabaena socialis TaxID=47790 RepID=A0A2J7ZY42_9CHLO|nr:hypothetical protein TSOC_008579 [Tetrabaena socialis]|eukprot:PNH05194.1 hypothetical protein TSOC_008579 [Tetrabaena socialis]
MAEERAEPWVRVQLRLVEDPQPHELVRKLTAKGNEVVEVDNFRFTRKGQPGPAPKQAEAVEGGPQEAPQAEAQTAGGQPDAAQPEHQERQQQQGSEGAQPSTPAAGQDVLCAGEDEEQGPSTSGAPEDSDELAAEGELSAEPAVVERDLNADVAGLLEFIPSQAPAAVRLAWLIEQALRMAVPEGDADAAASATAVVSTFKGALAQQLSAAGALLQGGGEQLQQYDGLAPMLREMCAGERLAASFRQRLEELEHEERAWLSVQDKYRRCGADRQQAVSAGDGARLKSGAAATIAAAAPHTVLAPDLGALSEAQRRADTQLGFQVDSVNTMLDKAERLVDQAQQACALMQACYHKENFQSYLHINSPQMLVKILSQAATNVDFVAASQPSQG